MITRRRRRLGWFVTVVVSLAAGAGAAMVGAAADSERVGAIWVAAEVGGSGSVEASGGPIDPARAQIIEVIDYDFGPNARHGIFRDVPDLAPEVDVSGFGRPPRQIVVDSPTAPDQFVVEPGVAGTRIKVGDPNRTITGRHRYTLEYPLAGMTSNGRFRYDAVGAFWEVPFEDVEIHVVAPFELSGLSCDRGSTGDRGGCLVSQPEPGHLVVRVDSLSAGQGITVGADLGAPLAGTPSPPPPPTGAATDPGDDLPRIGLAAFLAALLGAFPGVIITRRAGREEAAIGGPADIAYAEHVIATDPSTVQLVDAAELSQLATIEFVPPAGVTAAQGGVVLHERVRPEHSTAWLLNQAIFGAVDLDLDGTHPVIRRTAVPAPVAADDAIIAAMFAGRSEVKLHEYDSVFASGWKRVATSLEAWREASPLWNSQAKERKGRWIARSVLLTIVGTVVGLGGAGMASRFGGPWIAVVGVGFLGAGFGLGIGIRTWELLVRTPKGTATWIRLLSFKRFLAGSETEHVEWAAQHGMLREYTAWAVALDEAEHWARTIERSKIDTSASGLGAYEAVRFASIAPSLNRAVASASTAPSESSGGGGGGVGGGGGGGGGGSW